MSRASKSLSRLKHRARPFIRSATVYIGIAITALPDLLALIQAHYAEVAAIVPQAWLDPSMRILGILVLLARARTLLKSTESVA